VDLLDLFLPIGISSASRAKAFLWLCFHYLEGTSSNPFADERANRSSRKIPLLQMLTTEEMKSENVDTEEEMIWGEKMRLQRLQFQENISKTGKGPEETKGTKSIPRKGKGKQLTKENKGHRIAEKNKRERRCSAIIHALRNY
jgi:Ino eighty subunit 1